MDLTEVQPTDEELRAWDWQADLRRAERSIAWLSRRTSRAQRTIYSYRYGEYEAPLDWLREAHTVIRGGS